MSEELIVSYIKEIILTHILVIITLVLKLDVINVMCDIRFSIYIYI